MSETQQTKDRILIIGCGTVGNAQSHLMNHLGHPTFHYDPYVYPSINKPETQTDIAFICTPENQVENSIIELQENGFQGLTVIKSTTPLGETQKLSNKHKTHLCHNPEFLRETHSIHDIMKPSRILIGACCKKHAQQLLDLYKPLNTPTTTLRPTETELIKILTNTLRANSITFWNQVHLLTTALKIDTRKITNILDPEKTLWHYEGGSWGTRKFGEPYAGKCLPKDLQHLINAFKAHGLDTTLFDAIQEFNQIVHQRNHQETAMVKTE